MKYIYFFLLICIRFGELKASSLLVNMDDSQKDHLKAYGVAFLALRNQLEVQWLLNYEGGSFLIQFNQKIENELKLKDISYKILSDGAVNNILLEINKPDVNQEIVKLEKAPKIAVYSPKNKLPWDDAVTMVLTYANIPYDVIYDEDIIHGKLTLYDWLHLHHEDFTGQYGRFWSNYKNALWYQQDVKFQEETAKRLGFGKVSSMKLEVAKTIKSFCGAGGFLFAMCSGTDSYDISLAADGIDICESVFDGDGVDLNAQQKLDYSKTFAFKDFNIDLNPYNYEFSNIDNSLTRKVDRSEDYFILTEYSAKWDLIPTMLNQNHERVIKGFMGQTTAFNSNLVKPNILILGESKAAGEARYIHGEFGKGQFTFYGGHDPEDYQHLVGDPPTDLSLFPNSPGYRLILNNILFPAAKKKNQKT